MNWGGSGGSIYIITNILEGSGSITANGGQGYPDGCGGGGAGGRIAVYYNSIDGFSGDIQAYSGNGYKAGGAGTVFLKSSTQGPGDLIIDNNHSEGLTQLTENNYTFDNFKILNSAHFYLPENLTVTNIDVKNNSILETVSASTIDATQFVITEESSLVGPNQVFLIVNANILSIQSESEIVANVNINTGNLFIDSTSSIISDSKGYSAEQGPGAGNKDRTGGGSCSGWSAYWYGSGGGYGGQGGQGAYPACSGEVVEGGLPYGSLEEPMDLGSGGGNQGGAGGGAVRIDVVNTLTLNGLISANGKDGQNRKSGGGSGGSIYVKTNVLRGSGSITANGGQGYPDGCGGGGAGGRIAVCSQSDNFTGVIQAQGRTGYQDGEEGTIFLGD